MTKREEELARIAYQAIDLVQRLAEKPGNKLHYLEQAHDLRLRWERLAEEMRTNED